MAALDYPPGKRFHRFLGLDDDDVTETPRVNWGIRGRNAADLGLDYRVDV